MTWRSRRFGRDTRLEVQQQLEVNERGVAIDDPPDLAIDDRQHRDARRADSAAGAAGSRPSASRTRRETRHQRGRGRFGTARPARDAVARSRGTPGTRTPLNHGPCLGRCSHIKAGFPREARRSWRICHRGVGRRPQRLLHSPVFSGHEIGHRARISFLRINRLGSPRF